MAKKKRALTEQEKAEIRRKNTESKRKSRAIEAEEKKKNLASLEKQRKSYRSEIIDKSQQIWEKYLKDYYGE